MASIKPSRFFFIYLVLILLASSTPIHAFCKGDWLVRLRGIAVIPNDSSGSLSTVRNSGVKVGPSGTAELDFTYMWTDNIGTELILATTKHALKGKKALSGVRVGSTWVLPPTLTLQYHFFPQCDFQPYLGAGINYSLFYHKHSSLSHTHLDLRNSWGFAAQTGFDYIICDHVFLNFDAKYITMNTRAHLRGDTNGHVHVRVNPWVIGGGIGYQF